MKKRSVPQKKRILKELNSVREQTGLSKFNGKTRICLKCNRSFFSLGNWNRICEGCASIIVKKDEPMDSYRVGHP